ncbi:MAG: PepSY-associated TM helix domain-containing protein [Bacteroidia bacterium]|nr:PepSY-associated TM helix domain-containing protein [Bacteroidia bacterium]
MKKSTKKAIRKLNRFTHRDLGYFFCALIVIYCISGIALNHVDDWNPDFIITKSEIDISDQFPVSNPTPADIMSISQQVGESSYKVYDKPTANQVKIYYNNATLHINGYTHTAVYEEVKRRPVTYQANVLHRNSLKGWKWVSDIFAVLLITLSVTGLFILKGKKGLRGRGKWLVTAGLLLPILAWLIFELI